MAQLETWLRQDLKQPIKVQYLGGNLFSQDNQANLIGVEVFDEGVAATLGGSVSASVIRADGGTVAVPSGTVSGNKATVVLPQAAYAVPGQVSIVLKLTQSGVVTTLAALVAIVYKSSTDTVIDPGTILPSVETLIAQINTAVASIPADYSNLWATLAPVFDDNTAYAAGRYVTYNGHLYKYTADHAAGSFVTTDCTQVDVASELLLKADKTDTVLETTLSRGRKANTTVGIGSMAFGNQNTASGSYSVSLGDQSVASGANSYAHGKVVMSGSTMHYTTASGDTSHAEGAGTLASGTNSHAEGSLATASGNYAHAEGLRTTASGANSHVEGDSTSASAYASHAEGGETTASGFCAHAEGAGSIASGYTSHAEGAYTIANHKSQHTFGEFNIEDTSATEASERGTYIEIIGNGTGNNARSNARTLDWNGNEELAGDLKIHAGGNNELSVTELAGDVSSVKSAINDITNNIRIVFSDPALKQYIDTSGSTVSWDTPSVGATAMKWAVLECQPGDQFTISGKGGTPNRLWAFADASKNILDPRAAVGENVTNVILTAPDGAAYLIINDISDKTSYIGAVMVDRVDDLEQLENNVVGYERINFNKGTFISWGSSTTPWTYGAYNQNAATPVGILYSVKAGDAIEFINYTGILFTVYTVNSSNQYKRYTNQSSRFAFSEDCQMALSVQYNPGVALTDANYRALINRVYLVRKGAELNKRIDGNADNIANLFHITENVPTIVRVENLFINTNKYIDASTKLIDNSTGQNVTSAIPVKQGDVLNYLLRANSASVLIIALYSSNTPSVDSYIDGVTGGPVSSDWHKGQYTIPQNGYLFMTARTDALQNCYAYLSSEVSDEVSLLWSRTDPTVDVISQALGNEPQSNYGERYTKIRNSGNPTPISNFQSVANDFLEAHAGDMRIVPLIIYTDMHMLATSDTSAVFNLVADVLPEKEMSAYLNLGDIVNDHWTDDATYGLLKNAELEQFIKVTRALPKSRRIDVFGNHDTYYQPTGSELTALPSLKYVSPYFNNSHQRRVESCPDNSGNMVIYDGYYMVKYLIIADWDYTAAGYGYPAVSSNHWDWIIGQLAKVDDYDMVILSHVPLWLQENIAKNPYTGAVVGTTGYHGFVYHDDTANVLWTGRKNKTSGTFTDKSGTTHSYDFTACKGDLLCSLHGHVHYDGYQYIDNDLLEITFDRFSNNNSTHFVLIDRAERKIKTWKWTINAVPINYELPLDTE